MLFEEKVTKFTHVFFPSVYFWILENLVVASNSVQGAKTRSGVLKVTRTCNGFTLTEVKLIEVEVGAADASNVSCDPQDLIPVMARAVFFIRLFRDPILVKAD